MSEMKLRIKLVIEEAGKDFVDFLFSILTLPVSTLIRVLGKQEMVGSLPNLYESIETLNQSFFRTNVIKDRILSPVPPLSGYYVPIFCLKEPSPSKCFYTCFCALKNGTYAVSDYYPATCSSCHNTMWKDLRYVPPVAQEPSRSCEGGFVKESVTYMVMDDLGVKPMSTISSITTLLNQFNIKDVCALEEKVVDLGKNEVVKLLKASLVTKMVLTSVFLDAKKELP